MSSQLVIEYLDLCDLKEKLQRENAFLRKVLEEIRDVASISEGVEWYALVADRALRCASLEPSEVESKK